MTTKTPTLPKLPHGEGSLRWDDARGVVELQHRGRKYRVAPTASTPAAVKVAWKAAVAQRDAYLVESAKPVEVAASTATVADLFVEWLPLGSSGKAPWTVRGYVWGIQHCARIADVRLVDLTAGAIERMLLAEVQAGIAAHSMAKLRSTLNMALDYGVRSGYLPANPMRSLKTPKGSKRAKRTPYLDEVDAAAAAAHLAEQHSTGNSALLTILLCGLRPGEAVGLRWDAVDFEAGELHVRSAMRSTDEGAVVVDELKTSHHADAPEHDAAWRTVPLPPALARVLKTERTAQLARGRSEFVFADGKGRHHSGAWLKTYAKHTAAAIGSSPVSPNGYRHTFGSLLWNAGMPPTEVARLMGHRDTTMLTKVYGKPTARRVDTTAYFGAMAQ